MDEAIARPLAKELFSVDTPAVILIDVFVGKYL